MAQKRQLSAIKGKKISSFRPIGFSSTSSQPVGHLHDEVVQVRLFVKFGPQIR